MSSTSPTPWLLSPARKTSPKISAASTSPGCKNQWLARAQERLETYEAQRFPTVRNVELLASEAMFELPALLELR